MKGKSTGMLVTELLIERHPGLAAGDWEEAGIVLSQMATVIGGIFAVLAMRIGPSGAAKVLDSFCNMVEINIEEITDKGVAIHREKHDAGNAGID